MRSHITADSTENFESELASKLEFCFETKIEQSEHLFISFSFVRSVA